MWKVRRMIERKKPQDNYKMNIHSDNKLRMTLKKISDETKTEETKTEETNKNELTLDPG